jgi:hypothetical protein
MRSLHSLAVRAAASDADVSSRSTLSKRKMVVPASSPAVIFFRHSSSSCGAVVSSVTFPMAMASTKNARRDAPVPRFGLSMSARGTGPAMAGRMIGVSISPRAFARAAWFTNGKS